MAVYGPCELLGPNAAAVHNGQQLHHASQGKKAGRFCNAHALPHHDGLHILRQHGAEGQQLGRRASRRMVSVLAADGLGVGVRVGPVPYLKISVDNIASQTVVTEPSHKR
eukprot:9504034-Pyramimonas_sp.AAC.2